MQFKSNAPACRSHSQGEKAKNSTASNGTNCFPGAPIRVVTSGILKVRKDGLYAVVAVYVTHIVRCETETTSHPHVYDEYNGTDTFPGCWQ